MLTMGPGSGGGTKTPNDPDPTQHPKKKKRKKNKKGSETTTEGLAAAATKGTTLPPQTPKATPRPPTPTYCFRCGEEAHTIKDCKEVAGDLRCDRHVDTRNHKTRACSLWRKENRLNVHPWLEKKEASANRVEVEDENHIFGSHPDDSLEVISESDTSLTQPSSSNLHACHVTISGPVSSDDDEEVPAAPTRTKRKLSKGKFPAIW